MMRRLLFASAFLFMSFGASAADLQPTAPKIPVPPFVFEDTNNQQHSLSEYKGRFVLLNIWAAWCGPCIREMPLLADLQKNFDPAKLIILPISEDRSASVAENFFRTHALTFPVLVDQAGRAPFLLHLRGLPTSILIDPQGNEIARIEGGLSNDTAKMTADIRDKMKAN